MNYMANNIEKQENPALLVERGLLGDCNSD